MSSTDEQPALAPTRSSRRGSSVSSAVAKSNHPSPTPVDATTFELDDLQLYLAEGNKIFEQHLDFVNAPDEMIGILFMSSEEQRALQLNYPPKTHRRTARAIREWVRMGNKQKKELMAASASIEIETKFGVGGTTLCWNGSSWEERAVDDGPPSHAGSSSVHKHPMAHEGRGGCPGVTSEIIRNMRYTEARRDEVLLGFKHTCREGMSNRERFCHPNNNQWNFSPPTIGVVCHGNDPNDIRWTVEEQPHSPEEDSFDYLSIHAKECTKDAFVLGDDETKPICAECESFKKRLFERFDQNVKLREAEYNPSTRRTVMAKTSSLNKRPLEYHHNEQKKAKATISRRDKKIEMLNEATGVDIPINKASSYIFNESVADAAGDFLGKEFSQDSVAEFAFREAVKAHKVAHEKGAKSVRHSPLMIRFGAAVRQTMGHKGGLYELVAKVAGLPSGRTLRRYTVSNSNEPDGIMHHNCSRARDTFDQHNPNADDYDYARHTVLSFDSMNVKGRFGVSRNSNEIVAIEEEAFNDNVLRNELKQLEEDDEDESEEMAIPEIAKNFLVFIATTWSEKGKIQFLVARYGKKSLTARFLKREIRKMIVSLAFYGFIVDTIAGDGASENRSTFKLLATISARDILSKIYSDEELEGLPLDFKIAFPHPHFLYSKKITIVIGGEMPHWVKKFRNAFENKSRTLTFLGMEMNLDLIYQIWLASGDASLAAGAATRKYKFSHDHYVLNAYLKMRVFLAIQIPSQNTIKMIRDHCRDVANLDGPSADINDYEPMIQIFESVDRLVDIVNGSGFKKGKDRDVELLNHPKHRHIKELFGTLHLFEKWRKDAGGYTEKFITRQTYEDLQWLVYGYAAHAALYLKEDGSRVMHQGRGGSDVCEHFFSKIRYINSNPTMQQAREAASRVDGGLGMHLHAFQFDSKSNSGTAPSEVSPKDLLAPIKQKQHIKK